MAMKTAKRIASQLLGVGVNKLIIAQKEMKKVAEALTREDIRSLIQSGAIKYRPLFGVCRVRARKKEKQKRKGRRRGTGSRKGRRSARQDTKGTWIMLVRAQRKFIRKMFHAEEITHETYRKIYSRIKGGFFTKGRSQILAYLKDNKLLIDRKSVV